MSMIRTLLVLGRVSNLPTVWTNCLAGWVLVGPMFASLGLFLLNINSFLILLYGASLLYVGGMALNDVCDAKWDREHAPGRPIPAGRISRRTVALAALACLGAGTAMVLSLKLFAWPWVGGLLLAIVVYDLVHKRWKGSVLLMGACRFQLYILAGVTALRGEETAAMPAGLWMAAAGLFVYVVGITVAARGESTGGRVSGWAWLLLVSPVVAWLGAGGGGLGILMVGIFGGWLWRCAHHLKGENPARVGKFVGGLLAGIVLVDAMMASMADWKAAVICVLFFPLTLALQRYVPAT